MALIIVAGFAVVLVAILFVNRAQAAEAPPAVAPPGPTDADEARDWLGVINQILGTAFGVGTKIAGYFGGETEDPTGRAGSTSPSGLPYYGPAY
jgi:hypothetical protein